jgi:hypothetical protein
MPLIGLTCWAGQVPPAGSGSRVLDRRALHACAGSSVMLADMSNPFLAGGSVASPISAGVLRAE